MSGRPKIAVKEYNQERVLIAEYAFQNAIIKKYYNGESRNLWYKHPNIHLLKNGNIVTRNNANPNDVDSFPKRINRKDMTSQEKRTLSCYTSMISRCKGIGTKSVKYYVDKGITVCKTWLQSFDNFVKDMGLRPSYMYSIDRIDGNKGYYKDNFRWATIKTQMNNRSDNRVIKIPYTGFIEICGVNSPTSIEYHLGQGRTPLEIFKHFNPKQSK